MKMKYFVIVIFVSLINFSLARAENMSNIDKIETALASLLSRANSDAFVIFEETKTKKYVQFAGSNHEQLLLNLPVKALNSQELEKAKALFKHYSISLQRVPFSDSPASPIKGFTDEFDMKLERDTKKAAMITMRIFREVYGFAGDFKLGVEEN